uniref:Uncharacterized protein n=1 Tax=Rhizochromulina marina TaxID=1034831 RepID=A0A7S2W8A7_9STRA
MARSVVAAADTCGEGPGSEASGQADGHQESPLVVLRLHLAMSRRTRKKTTAHAEQHQPRPLAPLVIPRHSPATAPRPFVLSPTSPPFVPSSPPSSSSSSSWDDWEELDCIVYYDRVKHKLSALRAGRWQPVEPAGRSFIQPKQRSIVTTWWALPKDIRAAEQSGEGFMGREDDSLLHVARHLVKRTLGDIAVHPKHLWGGLSALDQVLGCDLFLASQVLWGDPASLPSSTLVPPFSPVEVRRRSSAVSPDSRRPSTATASSCPTPREAPTTPREAPTTPRVADHFEDEDSPDGQAVPLPPTTTAQQQGVAAERGRRKAPKPQSQVVTGAKEQPRSSAAGAGAASKRGEDDGSSSAGRRTYIAAATAAVAAAAAVPLALKPASAATAGATVAAASAQQEGQQETRDSAPAPPAKGKQRGDGK